MTRKIINRKVVSVLDALAEVGGLVNILLLVMSILIAWFQKFLYEQYLVSEIFLEASNAYYSRKQFDTPQLDDNEDTTGLGDMDLYRRRVLARQPFRFQLGSICEAMCACGVGKKARHFKARKKMWDQATAQIRKEFDILQLIKRMRKFELIKLVMLRQYQRRILRYAKKYVIEPLPSDEEPQMNAAELLEEQMDNVNRVIEGAKGGDKLDKKILKRLIPEDIYERNFPDYAEKAAQRRAKLMALK